MSNNITINIQKKVFKDKNNESPHVAIRNLNLKILQREFCAIIGPSGCGKSTLLNLISGLDKDFEGTINYENNTNFEDTRIAYMFQSPRLLPWLNVLENVEIVLSKKQKRSNKAKMFLKAMGLEKFLNYYPNKLSGGMQRRVALARSFASEPQLFILDEPFVSLDEPAANLLRDMLIQIWTREPTTILFVTHDLEEAIYLADRIVFLSKSPASIIKESIIKINRPRSDRKIEISRFKKNILKINKHILEGE